MAENTDRPLPRPALETNLPAVVHGQGFMSQGTVNFDIGMIARSGTNKVRKAIDIAVREVTRQYNAAKANVAALETVYADAVKALVPPSVFVTNLTNAHVAIKPFFPKAVIKSDPDGKVVYSFAPNHDTRRYKVAAEVVDGNRGTTVFTAVGEYDFPPGASKALDDIAEAEKVVRGFEAKLAELRDQKANLPNLLADMESAVVEHQLKIDPNGGQLVEALRGVVEQTVEELNTSLGIRIDVAALSAPKG